MFNLEKGPILALFLLQARVDLGDGVNGSLCQKAEYKLVFLRTCCNILIILKFLGLGEQINV